MSSVFYGNSVLANPHQLFRRWRFGVAASQTCAVSNAGTCMSDFLVANVNFLSALFPILSVVGLQGTVVLKSLLFYLWYLGLCWYWGLWYFKGASSGTWVSGALGTGLIAYSSTSRMCSLGLWYIKYKLWYLGLSYFEGQS